MTHKNLKRIAALTGALLAVNAGAGVFAPCSAEYGFAACAAESTEVATEEYEVWVSMETEETRHYYTMGEELSLAGFYISGFCKSFDEKGKLISETEFEHENLLEMIDNGTVTVDIGDFYTDICSGSRCITITYGTASTEIWVEVSNEKESHGMIIDALPIKTDYILGEELDLTGAKISGYFSDGKNRYELENADLQALVDEGTVRINTLDFYDTTQKSGKRSIYFGFYNAFGSFSVNVTDPNEENCTTLTSDVFDENDIITIGNQPTKTVYQIGEELDLTGAKFSGYSYKNNNFIGHFSFCDILEYAEKGVLDIDASEFDNTKPGTYTIYVNYGMATDSFEVTVECEKILPTGDSNGDGEFTVADVVVVQKHILGKKTAILSDWRSVDFCEDGKIDVYDLIVMKENFVENE